MPGSPFVIRRSMVVHPLLTCGRSRWVPPINPRAANRVSATWRARVGYRRGFVTGGVGRPPRVVAPSRFAASLIAISYSTGTVWTSPKRNESSSRARTRGSAITCSPRWSRTVIGSPGSISMADTSSHYENRTRCEFASSSVTSEETTTSRPRSERSGTGGAGSTFSSTTPRCSILPPSGIRRSPIRDASSR